MADPKYAQLPGIDTESPDTYETEDLPEEDQQTHYVDSVSDDIHSGEIDRGAAYNQFKNASLSSANVDFSDTIAKHRYYGYDVEPTEYELHPEGEKKPETLQQKFQRLQQEIRQLTEDVTHIEANTKESENADKLSAVQIGRQMEFLQRQMTDLRLDEVLASAIDVNITDPQGALQRRLLTQLDAFSTNTQALSDKKPTSTSASTGSVKYELHYKPEQAQFSKNAKLSSLEERLERLESVIGQKTDKLNVLSADTDNASLLGAVALLDSKLNLLDVGQLDQIEARLLSISHKLGQVVDKSVENPTQQSQISELYDIAKKWESTSESLPLIIDRLTALKELHEQALQFSQTLTYLDGEQQQLTSSLTVHSDLLKQVEKTVQANNAAMKDNMDSLQKRLDALQKK